MYKFSKNIRIRKCNDKAFLVNITNNEFFVVKATTLNFLEKKLDEGLIKSEVSKIGKEFEQFINELVRQDILEEIKK
ncbi:hypothetical protein P5F62_08490 [Clostridium perfringens]|nr:hypothetical protein [Clostridium perfringens]